MGAACGPHCPVLGRGRGLRRKTMADACGWPQLCSERVPPSHACCAPPGFLGFDCFPSGEWAVSVKTRAFLGAW